MDEMKTIRPPVREEIMCLYKTSVTTPLRQRNLDKGHSYFPTACAANQEPVIFTSTTLLQSSGFISSANVEFTTPAKQTRLFNAPSFSLISATTESMLSASVTLTPPVWILACGKSARSWEMASLASGSLNDAGRSRSARPEAPCSRNARADASARDPAPPVTVHGKSALTFD